jgi:DNA polymerase III subunit delta
LNPEQFLSKISKQPLAAAYLFLGQEGYQRRMCKEALLERALPGEARASGLTQVDLENTTLTAVLDDARSLSLFSSERVIWAASAELALPRRLTTAGNEETEASSASELAGYLKAPTPGTVLVFESSRYDFSGDDRPKLERVEKFYSAVPAVVEFRHFTPESSRFLAQTLARKFSLKLAGAELATLLETTAGDANRLESEIEKLSLFVGAGRAVTAADLTALVPHAAQTTIFNLVNALARRDRPNALAALDILVRDGEYLPLALTFLSTQFRLALALREQRISSVPQAQNVFQKMGVRMWRERAEQIVATAGVFTAAHLAKAIALIYETDKKFREGYKDDRTTMETLVFALTAS